MKLLIVESPTKTKTIKKYLGVGYKVTSSVGHIRDLPKSNKEAIDMENDFKPHYVISEGKEEVVSEESKTEKTKVEESKAEEVKDEIQSETKSKEEIK